MEKRPELYVGSKDEVELRVERTDISFHDLPGGRVRIQVTVHNAGAHRSPPTPMRLESAPLGAFVPWQPLTRLLVPPLEPGESRTLSADVPRPRPAALGDFNRVPPKRLLSAVNSADRPDRPPGAGVLGLLERLLRANSAYRSGRDSSDKTSLAADLWDLLGRRQPYWAGNINVFIGVHAVERHLARALRIYPGRTNLAMFVVGDPGTRDAYAFQIVGLAPGWEASLHEMGSRRNFLVDPSDKPLNETQWVESPGGLVVMLAAQPPVGCQTGNLEVHVTRRSSGKTAIVEFNLDPAAQGAGCYAV